MAERPSLRILLTPGETGPLVHLQDCARDVWEAERASRAERIEKRKQRGVGLDDGIDWTHVSSGDVSAAIAAKDSAKLRASAQSLIDSTAELITPLDPYKPDPDLDGICVRFKVILEGDRRALQARVAQAWRDVAALFGKQANESEIVKAQEAALGAQSAFVIATLAEIDGIARGDGSPIPVGPELCEALRREGLLGTVYDAASAFQGLPAKKALRFGQPLAPTSESSTAIPVQSNCVGDAGVTAAVSTSTGGPQ